MDPDKLGALNDPLLDALIHARDPAARDAEIERLMVTVTRPLAERIVSRYERTEGPINAADAEDIISTVNMRVVRKLRAIAESAEEAVRDVADYVARLSYNTINDHLRRRYPERTRLKNRLRYAFAHDGRLALWTSPAGLTAGLASSKGMTGVTVPALDHRSATRTMLDRERPADALVAIFHASGGPLLFATLIALTASLWDVADARVAAVEPADRGDAAQTRFEHRDFLRSLWREIRLLPVQQRKALLLNLRESETVSPVALLTFTGTATFDEIAATMEISAEELAALWNDLPLDDLRIAEMLGISRQQVINLRKSARQRLGRRVFGRKG